MTTATVTDYPISDDCGCVMLHDATGRRLCATMYGGKFGRTRAEAMQYVTDYAQRKGIVIVETQTEAASE